MDYKIVADPKGHSLYEPKFAENDRGIDFYTQGFFNAQPDQAASGFVKGVTIYKRESFLEDWEFDRYIENPAIDPFEGL